MAMRKRYCHFCGKRVDEVHLIIDGPATAICDECIDLMHWMIHETKPAPDGKNILQFREEARRRGVIK
jgi:ATP-dependent protease Clp ATPase subunit